MAFSYKQNYYIYLITLILGICYFWGAFPWLMNFRVEVMPLLTIRNLIGVGFFYLAYQIYRNQVDYY